MDLTWVPRHGWGMAGVRHGGSGQLCLCAQAPCHSSVSHPLLRLSQIPSDTNTCVTCLLSSGGRAQPVWTNLGAQGAAWKLPALWPLYDVCSEHRLQLESSLALPPGLSLADCLVLGRLLNLFGPLLPYWCSGADGDCELLDVRSGSAWPGSVTAHTCPSKHIPCVESLDLPLTEGVGAA